MPSAAFVFDRNNLVVEFQGGRNQGNPQTARALAMMNAAIYDSVNAIDPIHTVYHTDAGAFPGVTSASADAAAAQVAHDVVYALYTRTAEHEHADTLLSDQLNGVDDGPAEDAGVALGRSAAADILAWRASDGPGATVPDTHGTEPGDWQLTPPSSRGPSLPSSRRP